MIRPPQNPLFQPPVCVIQRGKPKSQMLAEAIVKGARGGKIMVTPHMSELPAGHIPVVIGAHPSTIETLRALHYNGHPYIYVDNGYFHPYKSGGYFRATCNALQWVDRWPYDRAEARNRWESRKLKVAPWREEGDHVLIALQTPTWYQMMGIDQDAWVRDVLERLTPWTKRKIIVRQKPLKGIQVPPLEEELKNAWAVVAYSSNVMLDASLQGIAVFPQRACAAQPLGTGQLSRIEEPRRVFDREGVYEELAAAQWTVPEMESGKMWTDLRCQYQPEFGRLA